MIDRAVAGQPLVIWSRDRTPGVSPRCPFTAKEMLESLSFCSNEALYTRWVFLLDVNPNIVLPFALEESRLKLPMLPYILIMIRVLVIPCVQRGCTVCPYMIPNEARYAAVHENKLTLADAIFLAMQILSLAYSGESNVIFSSCDSPPSDAIVVVCLRYLQSNVSTRSCIPQLRVRHLLSRV